MRVPVFCQLLAVILCLAVASPALAQCNWVSGSNTITQTCGNVGIGTTNAFRRLVVQGDLQMMGFPTGLYFGNGQQIFDNGGAGMVMNTAIANTSITLAPTGNLLLMPTGNVGLGTSAPTQRLHVEGNAFFSGTVTGGSIAAKYQDIAEWVPVDAELRPGMVVVLDPASSNRVLPSSRPYDTTVAGVVSANPGIALGEADVNSRLIATTGRVRVRTRATRPIKIGDLLVTSDVSGTAMPSEPLKIGDATLHRPGTIVGKALEPLANGEGEILVLLSLQ